MSVFNRDRKKPRVIINDKELEKEIGRWLGIKKHISNVFSKLLLNVGFKVDDEIVLYKYFYREDEYLSFSYIVNGCNPYKKNIIMLEYCKEDMKPRVIVYTGSKNTRSKIVYEVDKELDKYRVVSKSIEDKRYGMLNRRYLDDRALFFVEKDNYELCLYVSNPNDKIDGTYKLKNEKELFSYLNSLVFPIDIDLVYKKICEISLGDINVYPEFSLRVNKYDNIDGLDEVVDEITLKNGELEDFIITKDGKTIRIFGNDYGWFYEKKLDDRTLFVSYNDVDNSFIKKIIYENGIDSRDKSLCDNLDEVKNIAIKDVEDTKKLVRSIIYK